MGKQLTSDLPAWTCRIYTGKASFAGPASHLCVQEDLSSHIPKSVYPPNSYQFQPFWTLFWFILMYVLASALSIHVLQMATEEGEKRITPLALKEENDEDKDKRKKNRRGKGRASEFFFTCSPLFYDSNIPEQRILVSFLYQFQLSDLPFKEGCWNRLPMRSMIFSAVGWSSLFHLY